MLTAEAPFPQFFDHDGSPLDNGYVYIGLPDQNPETAAQATYWDVSGSEPATMPLRTLNGYPARSGTPTTVYVPGTFSITVRNKKGQLVYNARNSLDFSNSQKLYDRTNPAYGGALVGYKFNGANSVGRTVTDKLNDFVSAADFGVLPTNTGAQNVAALQNAITFANSIGGCQIRIPRGTYDFNGTISATGDNLHISGDGIDATILRISHATADFISTGNAMYQTFEGFTLTSTGPRTAGAMFKTGYWRRGLVYRVKVERHFDGINLPQFEHCTLMETNIVSPAGAGTSLIIGTAAASNQGANLNLVTVFIRGNDEDVPESPAVGSRAIIVYDIEAIYAINVDVSAFINEIMVIQPTFQAANCFFTSCYFDVTVSGDNVLVQGAGIKNRFQFENCWFAGAGRFGVGAADKFGIRFADVGSYIDWKFVGCQILGTSGPGFGTFTPQSEVIFSGCSFNNCGLNTTLNTAVYASIGVTQTKFMQFSGCKFIPSLVSYDFVFTANARGNVISGCELLRGVNYQGGAQFGAVGATSDPNTSDSVVSAATLQVPVTKSYAYVTGTTNVGGLYRTFTGHVISLTVVNGFTFLNGGALALKGAANFVAAAGNVLTLVCRADGSWQEISRSV